MDLLSLFQARNVETKFYRFFFVTNYSYFLGFIIHASFIYIFSYLEIDIMAKYNIASIFLFLLAFIINRKALYQFALILVIIEIPLHASLATHFVGWDSGFYVYLMALIPLIYFFPDWSNTVKMVLSVAITIFSLGLKYYSVENPPAMPITEDMINNLFYMNNTFFYVVLIFLSFYYSLAVKRSEEELQVSYEKINKLARTDPLTNLSNRRDTLERIELEALRCERAKSEMAIIVADIDNFKIFNDKYGHECGDFVLVAVADTVENLLRRGDHVGRWGGEEFIIVLPDTRLDKAMKVIEMLRDRLCNNSFKYKDVEHNVSMTFGVSVCHHSMDIEKCISAADKALLKGKQQGKNQVICAE